MPISTNPQKNIKWLMHHKKGRPAKQLIAIGIAEANAARKKKRKR